jgi:dihydrofolate synthase/folylpolyglutamate synthase
MSDKDIHAIIRSCRERFSGWFLTELPGVGRAMPAAKVAGILDEYSCTNVQVCSDPAAALATALAEILPTDTLVVFGSFYTVGGVLSSLGDERSKA